MRKVESWTVPEIDRYAYYKSLIKPEFWDLVKIVEGSQKQRDWADDIREKFLRNVERSAQATLCLRKCALEQMDGIVEKAADIVDRNVTAKYWIDRRTMIESMYRDIERTVLA